MKMITTVNFIILIKISYWISFSIYPLNIGELELSSPEVVHKSIDRILNNGSKILYDHYIESISEEYEKDLSMSILFTLVKVNFELRYILQSWLYTKYIHLVS